MKNVRLLVVFALMTMSSSLFASFNIRITNMSEKGPVRCYGWVPSADSSGMDREIQKGEYYLYKLPGKPSHIGCYSETYKKVSFGYAYDWEVKVSSGITPESRFAFYDDNNNPRLIRTDPPETGKQK